MNFGPIWVVIMPAGGARRVFTNIGPTPGCDLHVWFLVVEVASGEVARGAVVKSRDVVYDVIV
jgi:hypothetical protein